MTESQEKNSFEKPKLNKAWSAFWSIFTAFIILLANSSDNSSNNSTYTASYNNYNNLNGYSYNYENSVQTACQNAGIQMNLAIQDLNNGNIQEAAIHLRNAYTHAPAAEGLEELVNWYNAIAGQSDHINTDMYKGFGEGVRGVCAANQSYVSHLETQAYAMESRYSEIVSQENTSSDSNISIATIEQ